MSIFSRLQILCRQLPSFVSLSCRASRVTRRGAALLSLGVATPSIFLTCILVFNRHQTVATTERQVERPSSFDTRQDGANQANTKTHLHACIELLPRFKQSGRLGCVRPSLVACVRACICTHANRVTRSVAALFAWSRDVHARFCEFVIACIEWEISNSIEDERKAKRCPRHRRSSNKKCFIS